MKKILMISVVMTGINAFAAATQPSLQELRLKSILNAHSLPEIERSLQHVDHLEATRIICQQQLHLKKSPSACFEVLNEELAKKMISSKSAQATRQWLGSLCLENLDNETNLLSVKNLATSSAIPGECRDKASERMKDLQYQKISTGPAELFQARFGEPD